MLNLALTKMALIGVVALVVLGPKRLPRAARTAGVLFGRARNGMSTTSRQNSLARLNSTV
jgi:Sec-independent protein translocase protein TatA